MARASGYRLPRLCTWRLRLAVASRSGAESLEGNRAGGGAPDEPCAARPVGSDRPSVSLTYREAQVLDCLAAGLLNKEIADQLHVSLAVVKKNARRARHKLQAANCKEAVAVWANTAILERLTQEGALPQRAGAALQRVAAPRAALGAGRGPAPGRHAPKKPESPRPPR